MNDTMDSVERKPAAEPNADTAAKGNARNNKNDGEDVTDYPISSITRSNSNSNGIGVDVAISVIPVSPEPSAKRSSVVDIWRKRESNSHAKQSEGLVGARPGPTAPKLSARTAGKSSSASFLRDEDATSAISEYQATLNDVKTELSNRFTDVSAAVTSGGPSQKPTSPTTRDKPEEKKVTEPSSNNSENNDEVTRYGTTTTSARQPSATTTTKNQPSWNNNEDRGGSLRGVASASPTPPPLPSANRKRFATTQQRFDDDGSNMNLKSLPSAFTKKPTTKTSSQENDDSADLTILPSMSSASSVVSEAPSARRNNKMASIWQNMTKGNSSSTTTRSAGSDHTSVVDGVVALPDSSTIIPVVASRTPPQKRSVVDIWQKRASPDTNAVVVVQVSEPSFSPPSPVAVASEKQTTIVEKLPVYSPSLQAGAQTEKKINQFVQLKPTQPSTLPKRQQQNHDNVSPVRHSPSNRKMSIHIPFNKQQQQKDDTADDELTSKHADQIFTKPDDSNADIGVGAAKSDPQSIRTSSRRTTSVADRWTRRMDESSSSKVHEDFKEGVAVAATSASTESTLPVGRLGKSVKDQWSTQKGVTYEGHAHGTSSSHGESSGLAERWKDAQRSNSVSSSLSARNSPSDATPGAFYSLPARGKQPFRWKEPIPIQPPQLFYSESNAIPMATDPATTVTQGDGVNESPKALSTASTCDAIDLQQGPFAETNTGSTRQGKVTDRYPVAAFSRSPGDSNVSRNGILTSSVKKNDLATPVALSPNKVVGRWIEARSKNKTQESSRVGGLKTSSNDSLEKVGSGLNIIDAWIDSKTIQQDVAPPPNEENERAALTAKPSLQAVSVQDESSSIKHETHKVPNGSGYISSSVDKVSIGKIGVLNSRAKVSGGWKAQVAGSATTNVFDKDTLADLLGASSHIAPPMGTNDEAYKTVAGNIKRCEGESDPLIEQFAFHTAKKSIADTQISPIVVELVKEHAGQTPFGRRKLDVIDQGRKNISNDEMEKKETLAEAQQVVQQDTPAGDISQSEVAAMSESNRKPYTITGSRHHIADRWQKRLSRSEGISERNSGEAFKQDAIRLISDIENAQNQAKSNTEIDLMVGNKSAKDTSRMHSDVKTALVVNQRSFDLDFDASDEKVAKRTQEYICDCQDTDQSDGDEIANQNGTNKEEYETLLFSMREDPPGLQNGTSELAKSTSGSEFRSAPDVSNVESDLISKFSRESVASVRRSLDESFTPVSYEDAASVGATSVLASQQVTRSCNDNFLYESISFPRTVLPHSVGHLPTSGIESLHFLSAEQIDTSNVELGSPIRIIDAWSEKFASLSLTPSTNSNGNADKQVPSMGDTAEVKETVSSGSIRGINYESSYEQATADKKSVSPFQIIEAWSQHSNPLPSAPASTTTPPSPPKRITKEVPHTNCQEANVRPANSSAFAPWSGGSEPHTEINANESGDQQQKIKKVFKNLGRRHVAGRCSKKAGNTVTLENGFEGEQDVNTVTSNFKDSLETVSNNYEINVTSEPHSETKKGYQVSTPIASNRRGLDAADRSEFAENGLAANMSSTSSTRKLASDKMSCKKRLELYRRKSNKSNSALRETFDKDEADVSFQRDKTITPNDSADSNTAGDLESQTTGPQPHHGVIDSYESQQLMSFESGALTAESHDANMEAHAASLEAGQSHVSEYNASGFEEIIKTSSSVTSSSLANKAEKVLQQRRKKSSVHNNQQTMTGEASRGHDTKDVQSASPGSFTASGPGETAFSYHSDREEVLLDNGRRRLSTRYNTLSRFMDADGSTTSVSAPGTTSDGSESIGSSCVQSMETATTASECNARESSKVRLLKSNSEPDLLEEKSINVSGHSAWDSDWVNDVSMMAFDFNKIATVVDEKVAALRDFVGVSSTTKKQPRPNLDRNLTDVEDVAIEVEYVEDSYENDDVEDDDPDEDLGACTSPLDNVVKRSMQCSADAKAGLFPECSEMLPAGEPSFEQTPASRRNSRRTGYV